MAKKLVCLKIIDIFAKQNFIAMDKKELIQSYLLTTAKYDFSVHEKRIMYKIMECAQNKLSGLSLSGGVSYNPDLFGNVNITLPLKSIFPSESSVNIPTAKKAFISLVDKHFQFQNNDDWICCSLLNMVVIHKKLSTAEFQVNRYIWEAFLNFSQGYSTYFLQNAMSFSSVYSMRLYELLNNASKPLTYTVEWLRERFELKNKMPLYADFRRRVLLSSINEIYEKANLTITFEEHQQQKKGVGRPSVNSITFYVDKKLELNEQVNTELEKQRVDYRKILDSRIVDYLCYNYMFSEKEMYANKTLFYQLQCAIGADSMLDYLANMREKCRNARSPKGYLIKSIKNRFADSSDNSKETKTIIYPTTEKNAPLYKQRVNQVIN